MVNIQPGDIIFVRGKELYRADRNWFRYLLAWLISALTGSPYTHCAVVAFECMAVDANLGHKVMPIPLSEYRFYDVYRVRRATAEERQRAVFFSCSQFGKRYDIMGPVAIGIYKLFGFRLKRRANPDEWFCSELVDASWRLYPEPYRRSPGDLVKHLRLEFIGSAEAKSA